MENNIVLIYPMCISKNLHIICFWELNKKDCKRRLTVNLEISQQVILRVSRETSVCCLHCVDAHTDFNNCSCQEEWIGFLWHHSWASISILFGVWKKSQTEKKGKWISLGSWILQFGAKAEEMWYHFVAHLSPLPNSPWEHRKLCSHSRHWDAPCKLHGLVPQWVTSADQEEMLSSDFFKLKKY